MPVVKSSQLEQPRNTSQYRGRFAPSPTGPLHFGSLVAAVASYLEARTANGCWLVRMEDLDPPREVPGAADDILRTLDWHNLQWDESVVYQSQRHDAYHAALDELRQRGLIYHCTCSRKEILEQQNSSGLSVYPGTCRHVSRKPSSPHAIRIMTEPQEYGFTDRILGYFSHNIAKDVGDFVLKRADGWFAYQLAVVIDDADQGITNVVRGSDLLDNTPRQIFLQQLLGFDQPDYAHLPIVANKYGEKLSKQTMAQPVDNSTPAANLFKVLEFLGQDPPKELDSDSISDIWQWASENWNLDNIPKIPKILRDL